MPSDKLLDRCVALCPDLTDVPTRTGMIYWYLSKYYRDSTQRMAAIKIFLDEDLISIVSAHALAATTDLLPERHQRLLDGPKIDEITHNAVIEGFITFIDCPYQSNAPVSLDPDAKESLDEIWYAADDIMEIYSVDPADAPIESIEDHIRIFPFVDPQPMLVRLAAAVRRAVGKHRDLVIRIDNEEFLISPPFDQIVIGETKITIGEHEFDGTDFAMPLDGNIYIARDTLVAFLDPRFRRKAALTAVKRLSRMPDCTIKIENFQTDTGSISIPRLKSKAYSARTPIGMGRDLFIPLGMFGSGFADNSRVGLMLMHNGQYLYRESTERAQYAASEPQQANPGPVIQVLENMFSAIEEPIFGRA